MIPHLNAFVQPQHSPKPERVFFFSCQCLASSEDDDIRFGPRRFIPSPGMNSVVSGILRSAVDPADAAFWTMIQNTLQRELNLGPGQFTVTALSLLQDV